MSRNWNARTVIRRVLIICETLRKGEIPRFSLQGDLPYYDNDGNAIEFWGDYSNASEIDYIVGEGEGDLVWNLETGTLWKHLGTTWVDTNNSTYPLTGIALSFQKIDTPEFSFTQSSLREILQNIGSYVHGEPRLLEGDVITYDLYGGNEITEFSPEGYASMSISHDVERFATNLDSSADNFVNTLGNGIGAKTEPFAGGFKTVRTETLYSRIEDTNMLISTLNPIRSITKLEVGFVGAPYNTTEFYDLTAFVFESADYQRLSSYDAIYPLSKAYALYYSIGMPNINGLSFRNPQITEFEPLKNHSIINILNAVTGQNQTSLSNFPTLAFRVTYEPIYSARVQQSKANVGEYDKPSTIVYQQGQNLIESQYYGEHLKGAIAKMGNESKIITYVKQGIPDVLPRVGELWQDEDNEDWYITAIAYELQPYSLKFTINLTKEFQKYSDYVGINSNKRMFEISERQSFDSHITYTDYVVFGNANSYSVKNDGIVTLSSIMRIFREFTNMPTDTRKITFASLQGYTRNGDALQEVALPVQAIANGNSAVLVCKYKDNYSAGENATLVDGQYYQNGVAYSDFWGNMEYLSVKYFTSANDPSTFAEQTDVGAKLPIFDSSNLTPVFETSEPLWIKKGSTEIPTLNYQINFVSTDNSIIIGSALAKNLYAISGSTTSEVKAFFLPKRINKFSKKIDLTGALESGLVISSNEPADNPWITFRSSVRADLIDYDMQSWVVVDSNGELLFGANKQFVKEYSSFSFSTQIFIKHDIFKDKIQGGNQ